MCVCMYVCMYTEMYVVDICLYICLYFNSISCAVHIPYCLKLWPGRLFLSCNYPPATKQDRDYMRPAFIS